MARVNDYLPFNGLRGKPLTKGEAAALRLYARGASIPYIADRFEISESTVRSRLQKCINKLGAPNITSACFKARRMRII